VIAQTNIPAFPGAEGYGSTTVHGRGGQILYVTNLNDNGNGSLREACETKGARIIIFKVNGILQLNKRINIFESYCYIAGQTAPGDGICLKGSGINIATHDVVVRHIRSRPGDEIGEVPDDRDGIQVYPYEAYIKNRPAKAYNIVIDHCSVSWGLDENISFYGSLVPNSNIEVKNISLQWSIISEALSTNVGGAYGVLVAGGAYNISIHHNLMAHNSERHPLCKTGTSVEFINNLLYNTPNGMGVINEDNGNNHPNNSNFDIIGNVAIEGQNSINKGHVIALNGLYLTKPSQIFIFDNINKKRTNSLQPEWNVADISNIEQGELNLIKSTTALHGIFPITKYNTNDLKEILIQSAGAILPKRDFVDTRIINSINSVTGKVIKSQSEVGGYPIYNLGTPNTDSDNDGMPNAWETKYGFNPNNASDGNEDADKDGYTNIEEFLNGTLPKENITDITLVENNSQIQIYPNPASGELFISSAPIGSEISISDMSGRVLLNEKINSENQKIDVSNLKSGVYLAKVGG
jgi:hypothetical protein